MLREVLLVIKREEKFIKIAAGILLAFCTVLAQMKWFKGNVLMMAALYIFAFCYMGIGLLRIEPQTKKGCVALTFFGGFCSCCVRFSPVHPYILQQKVLKSSV